MTLTTFFKKFDTFADAPDAVAKMRELVLRLAMQGKLVSQNPLDEPADSLVDELKAEVRNNNSRRASPLPPIALDEIPFDLPAGWVWERLGEIGETNIGLTYSPQDVSHVGTPVLRSSNIQNGKLDFDDLVRVTCKPKQSVMVQDGDLLICARNGSRALVGKVALIEDLNEPAAFGAFMAIFRSRVNRFLYHFICSPLFRRMIDEVGTTTINQITQNNLRSTLAPLPPLAEQKRIVAKVDELMALCDRLEAEQQERQEQHAALARASLARFADAPTPANLNLLFHSSFSIPPSSLRKSILTLAVQGKLVPQDPNDEPVGDLLKRNLVERRKLKRTDATEMQSLPAEDGLGYDIPESWRWQRLDDLLVFGPTNGFSPKAVDYETPVRSLTLSATTSGRFNGEHSKFITTEVPASSDLWLRDGDILVQRGNTIEYVGVAAVYRGVPNCFVYPDLMMKLRVSAAFDVGFIHLAMSHEAARDFLRARASGTSGSMPKINQTTLKSLPLPIPPLAEQRRIVAKVDELMALVDALETQLATARTTATQLLEAVVGELTSTN